MKRPACFLACVVSCLLVPAASRADGRIAASPGPDGPGPATVRVYDLAPSLEAEFAPFPTPLGNTLAFGDVDGDAKDDLLAGPGNGQAYGPQVRAFLRDGTALSKVNFYAYGTLNWGVNVAGVDPDMPAAMPLGVHDEIVTGPGPGQVFGPHVRAFTMASGTVAPLSRINFFAYGTLRYGVNVGGGDVDGDLYEDILTTPGPAVAFAPDVRAFSFATGQVRPELAFLPFPTRYGARAAAGDIDGDGKAEILASPGPDPVAGPQVRGYDYDGVQVSAMGKVNFFAYGTLTGGGVRIAAGRLDGDVYEEMLVARESSVGNEMRTFEYDGNAITPNATLSFAPYGTGNVVPAISDTTYEFRQGFLWGSATAAHQVEGGNTNNDWYEWEQLGHTADVSGAACEEYTRYDEDFAIAQGLSHNVHRLSLEWSRIEPQRDVYDQSEIAHYHDVIDALLDRGITPLVTLHHFTNPIWVQSPASPGADLDGWTSQETEDEFVEFATLMAEEYGSKVDLWVTINEPVVTIFFGHVASVFPPGELFNFTNALAAANHMIFGHARAYDAIHALDTVDADGDGVAAAVSLAHHTRWFLPLDPSSPDDQFAAKHLEYLANDLFYYAIVDGMLDSDWDGLYTSAGEGYRAELAGRADYLGINYYGTYLVQYADLPPIYGLPQDNPDPNVEKNECGTEVYPQGLFRIVESFHRRWRLPVIITENGLCDADDDQRLSYTERHLRAIARAEAYGAEVRGYCHWSLVDNFEWVSGYGPKFGLVEVDFADQTRTVRPSALSFQAIIDANEVP